MQASGALNDVDAAKLAGETANALNNAWAKLIGMRASFVWDKLPDLGDIQSAIDQGAELARRRERDISEGRRLLALRDRHRKALAEMLGASEAVQRDLPGAVAAAETAKEEAACRHTALAAATESLTAARNAHTSVVALREADVVCETTRKDRERAESDLAKARAALGEAEQLVQRSERRAQFEARLRGEIADLERRRGISRNMIDRLREWLDLAGQIDRVEAQLRELQGLHPDIDNRVGIAASNLSKAQSLEVGAKEALRTVERSVSALSNAVSTIASHLSDDVHDCPVCATHFASSADLSARAGSAAERLAPLLVAQQNAVRDAQSVVVTATGTLEQLRGIAGRLAELMSQRNAHRNRNDRLLADLGLAVGAERSKVELSLAERVADEMRLEKSHRVRARWLGRLSVDGRAVSRASDAARRRDAARVAEATGARRLNDYTVAERVAGERLSTMADRLFPGGTPMSTAILSDGQRQAFDHVR